MIPRFGQGGTLASDTRQIAGITVRAAIRLLRGLNYRKPAVGGGKRRIR